MPVSIQLMSPASGDRSNLSLDAILGFVSIQLMSPASGDAGGEMRHIADKALEVSIQLMSPASGDLMM